LANYLNRQKLHYSFNINHKDPYQITTVENPKLLDSKEANLGAEQFEFYIQLVERAASVLF
jgi:hypothetical protein